MMISQKDKPCCYEMNGAAVRFGKDIGNAFITLIFIP
jgi:hypothetical protein